LAPGYQSLVLVLDSARFPLQYVTLLLLSLVLFLLSLRIPHYQSPVVAYTISSVVFSGKVGVGALIFNFLQSNSEQQKEIAFQNLVAP
jgi:hypothetical protein